MGPLLFFSIGARLTIKSMAGRADALVENVSAARMFRR
jgi:hypothetical protein